MPPEPFRGKVLLVGAGPGPADLMTVRAHKAVCEAQALLYDALVHPEVVALAPKACLKIQTGKRANQASMRQETINALMLRLARRGVPVVRLKGGDPSIFGRSGEESAFLSAHGVAVEIIPGVTAASAAAAQFAFPLTHRRTARRVVFATARLEDRSLALPAGFAGDSETTLVFYMARDEFPQIARSMISAGCNAETPCLAVENAGRHEARFWRSDLRGLPTMLQSLSVTGPVIIIVGDVAGLARHPCQTLSDVHDPVGPKRMVG